MELINVQHLHLVHPLMPHGAANTRASSNGRRARDSILRLAPPHVACTDAEDL
jgi:hypothetical protein